MKVKDLLTSKTWTKHAIARDNNDYVCRPTSPTACKWCLEGAIIKCYGVSSHQIFNKVDKYILTKNASNIIEYNDRVTTGFGHIQTLINTLDI